MYNIGSAFHTACLLLHFPPLHFWPYRIFHSRIFRRPVLSNSRDSCCASHLFGHYRQSQISISNTN